MFEIDDHETIVKTIPKSRQILPNVGYEDSEQLINRSLAKNIRMAAVPDGDSKPSAISRFRLCPAFCELATSQSRREIASLRDEPRQPLMATMVLSTRSNHAGLSRTKKRSPISRLAKARGLTATLKNQAARIIRSDTGCSALIQALSARDKVRQTGSSSESPEAASLSAASRHSSAQIERSRAAAGSKPISQIRQRPSK